MLGVVTLLLVNPILVKKHMNLCLNQLSMNPKLFSTKRLKDKGIVVSRCSRHMTGNKAYLAEYQDYNGGPVAFGGSKGYTTGKGKPCKSLPSKIFQNDHTYVACQKGNQHKASCKAKSASSISQALQLLHMDLFVPTSVRSLNHKTYCLVITDDFSRCDNGIEFKNKDFIKFCGSKGIKREYSNARTPQQNGVAERKNRTLIEAARTMLADSFLPNTFWAKIISTDCYVLNRPVRSENQANKHAGPKEANHIAGTQDNFDAGNSKMEVESAQDYFVLPIWSSYTSTVKSSEAKNEGEKPTKNTDLKTNEKPVDQEDQAFLDELERLKRQEKEANDAAEALRKEFAQDTKDLLLQAGAARASSTNTVNTASTPVSTASPSGGLSYTDLTNTDQDDSQIPALEDIYDNPNDGIFTNASYDDEGAVADFTNLETIVNVSPIPTSRIHSIHPSTQILGDPKSAVQTRSKVNKSSGAHAFVSYIQKQRRNNHKDFQHCLFACFLSQIEPKKISEALEDESWVDAMQEELLQFKIQKVWILVDLPYGKKAIGNWDKMVTEIRRMKVALGSFGPLLLYGFIVESDGCEECFCMAQLMRRVDIEEEQKNIDKTLFIKKDNNDIMYLKGKPKLGLWYPRVSSFDLEAYSDSDYAGANLDRKSTIGGCQFLGRRLISWQCKKQTIIATSTIEA
ncbi:putative ribonuclease H-like domain-containing protein [Tanacetum coccineum]|uniref:Ribonuclease H-like domain-containing protein n=1 Tax=Tanacetum coccineum TaxID=301880 RepID=A0ABQ5E203_9ASTR